MLMKTSEPINGFSDFIRDVVAEKFINQMSTTIRIDHNTVNSYFGARVNAARVIRSLYNAGFVATYKCDDRPCAEPYFEIILPPENK
jgi:phenylalanyl-tRNA synthetase beta subunit